MKKAGRGAVRRCVVLLLLAGLSFAQAQTAVPGGPVERLSGGQVSMPELLHGQITLVVASFSRASNAASLDWLRGAHADPELGRVRILQCVAMEGVPGFVRPLIRRGLRQQTPAAWQPDVLLLGQSRQQWQSLFAVRDPDQPAVALFDAHGALLWRGSGTFAASAHALKQALHAAEASHGDR